MKIGDRVEIEKLNGRDCNVFGEVVDFYMEDKVLIKSDTGRVWVISSKDLRRVNGNRETGNR